MKDTFNLLLNRIHTWNGSKPMFFWEVQVHDCILSAGKYNTAVSDSASMRTLCSDCGQETDDYIEVDGNHYHTDINHCILNNASKPGFVNICKISENPFLSEAEEMVRSKSGKWFKASAELGVLNIVPMGEE